MPRATDDRGADGAADAPEPGGRHRPGARVPDSLQEHTEELAARVHDAWLRGRAAEGWRSGDRRDDGARTHPGLVPYEELPEAEKEYDHRTVWAVIRGLVDLGYRVVEPEGRTC